MRAPNQRTAHLDKKPASLQHRSMSHTEAQQKAHSLLEAVAAGRFPVPVVQIADSLGISVLADPDYPHDLNGHISLDDSGKQVIVVNERHFPERKRFTIAHEIAHAQFDMDYLRQHRIIDRDGNAADPSYRARERRANDFAANLLMPEKQFIEQWIALGSLDKVSDYFFVSKDAAKYRAINLGILSA